MRRLGLMLSAVVLLGATGCAATAKLFSPDKRTEIDLSPVTTSTTEIHSKVVDTIGEVGELRNTFKADVANLRNDLHNEFKTEAGNVTNELKYWVYAILIIVVFAFAVLWLVIRQNSYATQKPRWEAAKGKACGHVVP